MRPGTGVGLPEPLQAAEGRVRKPNPETELKKGIQEALELLPAVLFVERVQSGAVPTRSGWLQLAREGTPDLMGLLDTGIHLEVEVKVPGGKTKPAQDEHLAKSRKAGACAIVATSAQGAVLQVIRFLEGGVAALPPLPADEPRPPPRRPPRKMPAPTPSTFRGQVRLL